MSTVSAKSLVQWVRGCSGDTLQWRHNERDGVSNHQHLDCLLKRLFRRRSKKTSKPRVTGLCARNSYVRNVRTSHAKITQIVPVSFDPKIHTDQHNDTTCIMVISALHKDTGFTRTYVICLSGSARKCVIGEHVLKCFANVGPMAYFIYNHTVKLDYLYVRIFRVNSCYH